MTVFLDRDDVLCAAAAALDGLPEVADYGLLDAAVARPSATVFGLDAYPSLLTKAAALLHSLARNHALVDGNKRTAWAAAWTFLTINGVELSAIYDVDAAEQLMLDVATGVQESVDEIASALEGFAA
ncbi:type II toxin-antitoxin system death-on-curing family toxin [Mycobacterium avium subsp. hominissuis]|uniref:type II toxin-antitoxin system death-on-curing family toxin n=1 Tax=Mycobacterium avium TaxID=1764 RepID=UPI0026665327|nr:type II toxin-antitoxin system death-on-curing family toxin [Mycobacterium avium]MDO2394853.1 type II toxin-antitoxin system death-on-curing family toxin [Mycobacterium avium subsp. hominissuis]